MRRYVRVIKSDSSPQAAAIWSNGHYYRPIIWHTAIDQDRPVGSRNTFSEHSHDFYHVVFYTKGGGSYSREGRFYETTAGSCVVIHPGQKHDFISRRGTAVYSEITFSYETDDGSVCTLSFDQLLSCIKGTRVHLLETIHLLKDFHSMFQGYLIQITDYLNSSSPQSLYYAHWTLEHIFNCLIEHCCEKKHEEIIDDRLMRTRLWIEENYQETLSMDDLAKMAGFSKGYFFRAFRHVFGISPLAYQQKLRIKAAKTLLKTTTLQCREIAYRIGFNDVYFFHRVFKKNTQYTPNQYRKQCIS